MSNYDKKVQGSSTYHERSPVDCDNASIEVLDSSTFIAKSITCRQAADVYVHSSSKADIQNLKAPKMRLRVTSSSTLRIGKIDCPDVSIWVDGAATLRIDGGQIGTIRGEVNNASTGRSRATIQDDQVQVDAHRNWWAFPSTWDA